MADIIPFPKSPQKKKTPAATPGKKNIAAKNSPDKKLAGNTLCKTGFHKWKVDNTSAFAVREGKLLTRYICERCGKTKIETT